MEESGARKGEGLREESVEGGGLGIKVGVREDKG